MGDEEDVVGSAAAGALERGECAERGIAVAAVDDVDLRVLLEQVFGGGEGLVALALAVDAGDDLGLGIGGGEALDEAVCAVDDLLGGGALDGGDEGLGVGAKLCVEALGSLGAGLLGGFGLRDADEGGIGLLTVMDGEGDDRDAGLLGFLDRRDAGGLIGQAEDDAVHLLCDQVFHGRCLFGSIELAVALDQGEAQLLGVVLHVL